MNFSRSFLFEEAGGGAGGGGGGGSATLLSGAAGAPPAGGTPPAGGAPGTGAPVVQKPWREGWIAADGKINKAAYDALPDHLKGFRATFEKYPTDEALLGALGHAESLVGKKGLMPLPANASDQDKAEFRKRLNEVLRVPEKPEGYGIKKPDGVPDEHWDGEFLNGVLAIAHKHSVSPEALQELVAYNQKYGTDSLTKAEAAKQSAFKQAVDGLRTEWANEFDSKLFQAKKVALTLGLDVDAPGIGDNVDVIRALAKVAGMVSEDKLVTGGTQGMGPTPTEQIQAIMYDSAHPLYQAYRDPNHAQHKQATDLVLKLTQEEVAAKKASGK